MPQALLEEHLSAELTVPGRHVRRAVFGSRVVSLQVASVHVVITAAGSHGAQAAVCKWTATNTVLDEYMHRVATDRCSI